MTAPFQMVGDPTAAACVGDVCEIPQAAAAASAPEHPSPEQPSPDQPSPEQPSPEQPSPEQPVHLSEQAVVNQRLDEDLV
jgi:hypothetical protein